MKTTQLKKFVTDLREYAAKLTSYKTPVKGDNLWLAKQFADLSDKLNKGFAVEVTEMADALDKIISDDSAKDGEQ